MKTLRQFAAILLLITVPGSISAQSRFNITAPCVTGPAGPPAANSPNRWCAQNGAAGAHFLGIVTGLAQDGPAHPLQNCLYTEKSNTPTPGTVWNLTGGCSAFPCANDIVTTYNSAACGDIITLDPAFTWDYHAHAMLMSPKNCDDAHWIEIRTLTGLTALGADEHTRISPCWANVASLPGRPSFTASCPTGGAAQVLAKIIPAAGSTNAAITGDHIRWTGIEWGRASGTAQITQYMDLTSAHAIIFDRNWWHGTALDETRHGIQIQTANEIAVINSYFSDFHCYSGGACDQASAINGGLGTMPDSGATAGCKALGVAEPSCPCISGLAYTVGCPGIYKFQNNFIEAAGENIIFGGGGANFVPVDFEIRGDHLFKPLFWNKNCSTNNGCGTPGSYIFSGSASNLTSIQRTSNVVTAIFATLPPGGQVSTGAVLTIAATSDSTLNVTLVGTVSGSGPYTFVAAQTGSNTSLISSSGTVNVPPFNCENDFEMKNGARMLFEDNILENSWGGFSQDGFAFLLTPKNQSAVCLICYDADYTIRWNLFTGTADGIQVAAVASDTGALAVGIERITLHDVVMDGGFADASSTGYGLELTFACGMFTRDITFDHVSWVKVPHSFLLIGTTTGACSPVPTFARVAFTNSIMDAGTLSATLTNGATGCQNALSTHNVKTVLDPCALPYTWGGNAVSSYANTFLTWPALVTHFNSTTGIYTSYNSGYGGDYRVTLASGLQGTGLDGADIGANITLVAAETGWAQ